MTSLPKTATPSDPVSRHDQLVEAYAQFKRLLTEFGYELWADDFDGCDVDLDVRSAGNHLFTIDTVERAF